jgi:hypothetical protein
MSATLLAGALDRVRMGWTLDRAFDEFLEAFFLASTCETRFALLSEEPPLTGDCRLDALAGAVAEYLAKQHRLGRVPAWAGHSTRYLDMPWHLCASGDDGMREYLTFASPGEFRSHIIFTEERPLRWGRSGQPH